ncbi:MAG: L,D-transpeptidase/peptidoglycan binding protein [Actinomycetota bacterium]|nr:L,D-transpeptidase/peptidoglycan binding protein [Actinomycetota bacterium]
MHPAVADVQEPAAFAPTIAQPPAPSKPPRRFLRRSLIGGAVLLALAGSGVGAAYAYDRSTDDRFLPGVRVADVDVEGQRPAEVVSNVDARFRAEGDKEVPVTVVGANSGNGGNGGNKAPASPSLEELGLRADTAAVVARAHSDERSMGMPRRVWHRLLGKPVDRSYPVRFRLDAGRVTAVMANLAKEVDRKPEDAKIDTSTGFVTITPAVPGRALDQKLGQSRLMEAGERLANGEAPGSETAKAGVEVPVGAIPPKVTTYADVILIRTNENRLYHYENGALARAYTVATGTPQYPTPKGRFQITLKRFRPTWVNPDPGGWGASLPPSIPPGPGNPLGTRALNLNAPGIRIHGTANVASLGTAASHGCIRMSIPESEALFDRVETGTPVIIIPGPGVIKPAPAVPSSTFNPAAPVDLEAG